MDPENDLRVLFLMPCPIGMTEGTVLLMVTDVIGPYSTRIVGLMALDGSVEGIVKDDEAAFNWVEAVFGDLGISLAADMVRSVPAPDMDDIEFDGLDMWVRTVFDGVFKAGKLLIP